MTGIKFSFYESASATEVEKSVEVDESIEVGNIERIATADSEEDGISVKIDGFGEEEFVDAREEGPVGIVVDKVTAHKPEAGPAANKSVTKLTQTKSEDTYATEALSIVPTTSFASTINPADEDALAVSTSVSHVQVLPPIPATPPSSNTPASHKLSARMLERVQAMNKIRSLLESEKAHETQVISKFTAKIAELERTISSKDKKIGALTKNTQMLETKNTDCALQLSDLATAMDELVESNNEKTQRIEDLEQDAAAMDSIIKDMDEDIQDKQLTLDKNSMENAALTGQLENSNAQNKDLEAKNAEYTLQLSNLSSTINELVENNKEHVHRITQLEKDASTKDSTIKEMDEDIQGKQLALDKNIKENMDLVEKLETFKAENLTLDAMAQELEATILARRTSKRMMSSMQMASTPDN